MIIRLINCRLIEHRNNQELLTILTLITNVYSDFVCNLLICRSIQLRHHKVVIQDGAQSRTIKAITLAFCMQHLQHQCQHKHWGLKPLYRSQSYLILKLEFRINIMYLNMCITCTHTYRYTHIYMHKHICADTHTYTNMYTYTHIHIHTYIYTYIYIYTPPIHTHTYI